MVAFVYTSKVEQLWKRFGILLLKYLSASLQNMFPNSCIKHPYVLYRNLEKKIYSFLHIAMDTQTHTFSQFVCALLLFVYPAFYLIKFPFKLEDNF